MVARSRFVAENRKSGFRHRNGVWVGNENSECIRYTKGVDDHHKVTEDNQPFLCNELLTEGGEINRPYTNGFNAAFFNYVADALRSTTFFNHWGTGSPSDNDCAVSAAARTNPSRPYVDLPVAVFELGDIAQLIRDSGRSLLRKAAGANLKTQFGILPLAGDIAKLLQFQKALDFRAKEVNRLFSDRGLRRTVTIGKYSHTEPVNGVVIQSAFQTIGMNFTGTTVEEVRVHIRWKPTEPIPNNVLGSDRLRYLTKSAMLGLRMDASTAWEAIPFSWLADWGGNVGQYLAAKRNVLPAEIYSIRVIRHRVSEWRGYGWQSDTTRVNDVKAKLVGKSRQPVTSFHPTANLPILDGRKAGILASLYVMRGRR